MAPRRRPPPPTDGPRVARFAEQFCRHVKGFTGPVVFEPWQRAAVDLAFEIDPKTGLRVFNEVLFGWPRGQSKSTTCATLGLYGLLADREPGPEVISAAGKKDQAREVHGVALTMAKKNPDLAELLDTSNADEIRVLDEDGDVSGKWGLITSSGDLEQGSNPSMGIIDELHVHKDGSTYNAIFSGAMAKREQTLLMSITTAGSDKGTFLGGVYDAMLKLPNVERPTPYMQVATDRENGQAMIWYGVPDDMVESVDLDDPAVWAGCNPASWLTERKLRRIRNSPSITDQQFVRFHLNAWKQRSGQGGIPEELWSACYEPSVFRDGVLPAGTEVVVGVDGGWRDDWTAVVLAGMVGDRVAVEAYLFPPAEDADVDLDEAVCGTLREVLSRVRVREVCGDPAKIQSVLQAVGKMGLAVWEYHASSTKTRVASSLALWKAIKTRQLAHDGDDDLTDHALNARMADTRFGEFTFEKPLLEGSRVTVDRTKKIDGLVATQIAVWRLGMREPSAYMEEGFFSF